MRVVLRRRREGVKVPVGPCSKEAATKVQRVFLGLLVAGLFATSCSGPTSGGSASSSPTSGGSASSSPTLQQYTLGGPFGGDDSGIDCDIEGNAVTVRDGTGSVIGTTVMKMTDKKGSGDNCYGQASWSVRVPHADFYRVELETDLPGPGPLFVLKSDRFSFDELETAEFKLYLKSGLAHGQFWLVRVPPW
jgi:hypothetical protein